MKYDWKILSPIVLAFIFTACPETTPTPQGVAKVTLETPSVLLPSLNATQQLIAKAFDAQGNLVTAKINWQSSKPNNISVDANGVVTGVAVGSSQLSANVGSVKSAPILAAVAELNSDMTNIPASDVESDPVFETAATTTRNIAPRAVSVGSRYSVIVKRSALPTVGKKWYSEGRNGQRLIGKVVAAEALGSDRYKITLEVVPYQDVFKQLLIDEDIDFSKAQTFIPPAVNYEPTAAGVVRPQAFVNVGNGLECELSGISGTPPISLSIPQMSIGYNNDESRTGLFVNIGFGQPNTIVLRLAGKLTAAMTLSGRITRNFNGTVDCRVSAPIAVAVAVPMPMFTSLGEERGLGIAFSGNFSGPTTNFSAEGSSSISYSIGAKLDLDAGTITPFNTVTPTNNVAIRYANTGLQISRIKLSASPYVFENWVFRAGPLAFDIWKNQNGLRFKADLATLGDQLSDPNYTSSYALERFHKQGPGAEFHDLMNFLNAGALLPPSSSSSTPIAQDFTLESFACNVSNFGLCITRFTDKSFPFIGANNIDKLEIYRKRGTTSTLLATDTGVNVTNIVTTFPSNQVQAGDQCQLVVYTKLMPGIPLEAANDSSCDSN
jgi:hypothetical protein